MLRKSFYCRFVNYIEIEGVEKMHITAPALALFLTLGVSCNNSSNSSAPAPDSPNQSSSNQPTSETTGLNDTAITTVSIGGEITVIFSPTGVPDLSATLSYLIPNPFESLSSGKSIATAYKVSVLDSKGNIVDTITPYNVTFKIPKTSVSVVENLGVILYDIKDNVKIFFPYDQLDISVEGDSYEIDVTLNFTEVEFSAFELNDGITLPDGYTSGSPTVSIASVSFDALPGVQENVPFSVTVTTLDGDGQVVVDPTFPLKIRLLNASSNQEISGCTLPDAVLSTDGHYVFEGIVIPNTTEFKVEIYSDDPSFHATGSISAAAITPTARQWFEPAALANFISVSGTEAVRPVVAMNDQGKRLVAWGQFDSGAKIRIMTAEFNSGAWELPSNVDLDAKSHAADSLWSINAHMNASGDILMIFGLLNSTLRLFIAERINGVWSFPGSDSDAISPTAGLAGAPVAYTAKGSLADNGDATIVWTQQYDGVNQIFMSKKRNGVWTHPSTPFIGDKTNNASCSVTSFATDANGVGAMTWYRFKASDTPQSKAFVSNFDGTNFSNLAFTSPYTHPDATGGSGRFVVSRNGKGILVWAQYHDILSETMIYRTTYDNGTWGSFPGKDGYFAFNTESHDIPSAAVAPNGDITLIWIAPNSYSYFMAERTNGTWADPNNTGDKIFQSSGGPNTAHIARNNSTVFSIWNSATGSTQGVFESYRVNSTTWSFPSGDSDVISLIATDTGADSLSESLAMDSYGNVLEAWHQDSDSGAGTENQIYIREFR